MREYLVGVDIGGTNTKIGVLNSEGTIMKSIHIKTEGDMGPDFVLEKIKDAVLGLLVDTKIDIESVMGLGMGIPGPANTDTGVVEFCVNLKGWEKLNVCQVFGEKLGIPVYIGNDVNVITLGEAWKGSAKSYKNILGIAIGTGIGGGIIVNGKLVSGTGGAVGEVGHIKVERNGKLCSCGQRGCWEAYASATGLIREAKSRLSVKRENFLLESLDGNIEDLEAEHVFNAAKKGDKFSKELVKYEVEYLAYGLSILVNTLNPELVVLGGGVSLAGDILFEPLKKELEKYTLSGSIENLKILPASLGNEAGIIGAAALAAFR